MSNKEYLHLVLLGINPIRYILFEDELNQTLIKNNIKPLTL